MLEIKHLTKIYKGGKRAVDDVSLTVNDGEIFGFIGHNGAGKSTTIKAIAGIIDFNDGEILIDGKSIRKNPIEVKRITAYIPDNPDIYNHLTGIQYLDFIASVYGVKADKKTELIKKYADLFEMTPSLGNLTSSYSHGMRQKLCIISALIHEPKLLVMDEPFVGLDPVATFKLKEIMKEMCKNGCSIFFSTHVLEVAEKLCDRVAIIKDGKLVVTGDMKEVTKNESLEDVFMELVENDG